MLSATEYYMLVASLPHMPRTFLVERVPISQSRLAERLKLLSPSDADVVSQVQRFLQWDRQPTARSDQEIQQEYDRLMQSIKNLLVRRIVEYRMDVRTITSALRRRRLGMTAPTGVGRWVDHIRKNWDQDNFRIVRDHPWVPLVCKSLSTNDPLEVERLLLQATWAEWTNLADQYHFTFESVLLYLSRWEIVDRWTRLNESQGRNRFDILLKEALGEQQHANW
ncbi:MAG: DUF2764 family protein [Planctomycetaceae bacterium]|nr:DUF2764 family protein [Planctomycetaceae bacterium]